MVIKQRSPKEEAHPDEAKELKEDVGDIGDIGEFLQSWSKYSLQKDWQLWYNSYLEEI